MDSEAALFLLTPEGREVVASLEKTGGDPLAMGQFLRKRFPALKPSFLAAAAELRETRGRAHEKFSRAGELFFTREALEQSTGERVAAHRAERFRGLGAVCDLCCGIGGDAIALGREVRHLACVDRDRSRIAFCRENLRILGIPVSTIEADCADMRDRMGEYDAVFIDPSRRTGGKRVRTVESMEPPMETVLDLLGRAPGGAAKLPPAFDLQSAGAGRELEWVSTGTGLKEAVLWTGSLQRAGVSVTLLHRGVSITDREVPATAPDISGPKAFLYEPDPALIRSGLLGGVAVSRGMSLLDRQIAYTVADALIDDPLFTGFRVLDSFPFNLKRLRECLQSLDAGPVTVKKRGFPLEPEDILKKLALAGRRAVTIVLARIGNGHRVFVVEPLKAPFPVKDNGE